MQSEIQFLHKKMSFDEEIIMWSVNNDLEFIIRKEDIIKETGTINDLIKVIRTDGEILIIDTDAIIAIKLREKKEW